MFPYFCRRKSSVAVPINILICPVRIYMLTVFNVKSAVIMLGIVNAIFSSSAVMPCQFHSIVFSPFVQFSIRRKLPGSSAHFLPKRSLGERQLCCQSCRFQRQAIPSTSRRKHQLYWAMAAALDLHREASLPVPFSKNAKYQLHLSSTDRSGA